MAKLSHIRTERDLDTAIAALLQADPRFAPLIAAAGRPPLRRRPDGFAGLATTVVSQQLSTASAGAIWGRLAAAFDPFEPEAIMRARAPRLARAGLSSPKIRALKAIARAVAHGKLPLSALADLPADEAHAALTAVHGIGPWTADIYLLSCLGHADAWPAGDLALQEAARIAFGLRARPTAKEMAALAEPWRPWRAVAARVLWTYYRSIKGREGAPVAPAPTHNPARIEDRKAKASMAAELDGPRLAPKSGAAQQLVVFLHGYGADGNDLIDIGRAWQQILPHAAFVSPHAPEPCGTGAGGPAMVFTYASANRATRAGIGVNKAAPVLERLSRCRACAPQAAADCARACRFQPRHDDGAPCRIAPRCRRRRQSSAIPAVLVAPPDVDADAFAAEIKVTPASAAGSRRP